MTGPSKNPGMNQMIKDGYDQYKMTKRRPVADKVRKKPLPKVSKPEPLFAENDIAKPTPIVGKPSLGVDPNL